MVVVTRDGCCAVVTIDRPQTRNALDAATMTALDAAMQQTAEDASVRAVVLTGAGGAFVSGGDLRELQHKTSRVDAAELSDRGEALCRTIESLAVPVIAVIAGPALGGGAELALACDLRIAEAQATLGFVQARMGVTTAWGSTARLISCVGASRAARLLLLGQTVSASKAHELSLVDEVVERGGGLALASAWAAQSASCSQAAVAALKGLLVRGRQRIYDDLRPHERAAFIETWTGSDHLEAVRGHFARRR